MRQIAIAVWRNTARHFHTILLKSLFSPKIHCMRFIHLSLICAVAALGNVATADNQRVHYINMTTAPLFNETAYPIHSPVLHSSERSDLVKFAKTLLGTPYRYGGSNRNGFDCSGLVHFVFAQSGHQLPRISREQFQALTPVDDPQIGDLVFFGRGSRVSHVGIYVGDNKMLHAPSSGKTVVIESFDSGYWGKRYLGARSVIEPTEVQIASIATQKPHNNH